MLETASPELRKAYLLTNTALIYRILHAVIIIYEPENEEFIKSRIAELAKKKLEEKKILPPIQGLMRKGFLERRK